MFTRGQLPIAYQNENKISWPLSMRDLIENSNKNEDQTFGLARQIT